MGTFKRFNLQPSVGIGSYELDKKQKELEQRGLKKRVELIGMLRMKSQVMPLYLVISLLKF